MTGYFDFDVVPFWDAVLRVALSAGLAMIIGLERDIKKKPIDFRAYMIVATISCVLAMVAQELYADYQRPDTNVRLDFMRVIEGVLTGIGFLGAGAILKGRSDKTHPVVGTATAASIWASGGLGLALGFGFYGLALIAFAAIAGTLFIFGFLMPVMVDQQDGRDVEEMEQSLDK